ncbi:MAG: radical SAM family heme chaperone HemW [Pelosinus sp.]|nr:radical SAM family heme chaperone HemW [Pelosinus sp.]
MALVKSMEAAMTIGLYIHIPFCKQKCFYCDFPSYSGLDNLYEEYTAALCREIAERASGLSAVADTVFIGGGTPSILPADLLIQILQAIEGSFIIAKGAEISMEANPGTVNLEKLHILRQYGVNRLSFGVQSFQDTLLRGIGRIHSADEAKEAVSLAKKAGFDNINVDLIYGLPHQTLDDVKASLKEAVSLDIQHISVYGLKVEEGTAFAAQEAAGNLVLPADVMDEAMYEEVNRFLPEQGFARYEISNFAKANYSCRHNIKYWQYQPYIGLGAAAYSFVGGKRFGNTIDVKKYINCVKTARAPVEFTEEVNKKNAMAEFIFLALRMTDGLDIPKFNAYFHTDFFYCYKKTVQRLVKERLLAANQENIHLTARGMKFGNLVFRAFLPD